MDRREMDLALGRDGDRQPVDISVVLPAYNEADCVTGMYRQVTDVLEREDFSYEILFIDDGSSDGTWMQLKALTAKDHRVRALRHRRNFGKASALANGFTFARGQIIVTSDADMQYDPHDIVRMIEKVREGYQVVSAYKVIRRDPLSRRVASKVFNFVVRNSTGIHLHDFNAGLKAYDRDAALALVPYGYGELHRFFVLLAARRGFTAAEVPVESVPRPNGRSKYGLERYVRGGLDFLTAFFLASYVERPLHLLGGVGLALSATGAAILAYLGYLALIAQQSVANRPLLTVAVLFVLSGIQLIVVGLIAEMMNNLDRGSSNPAKISQVLGINRRTTVLPASEVPLERRGSEQHRRAVENVAAHERTASERVTARDGEPEPVFAESRPQIEPS